MERRTHGGFTMVEMLLALSITAMICTTVLGMLFAMSRGTGDQMEAGQEMLEAAVIRARMNAAVRSASQVLVSGESKLVLWKGDTRRDNAVNISELVRIEYVGSGSEIRIYEAPAGLTQEQDTGYPDGTNYDSVTQALVSTNTLGTSVVASNVQSLSLVVTTAGADDATLINYEIQLAGASQAVVGGASLRGRK